MKTLQEKKKNTSISHEYRCKNSKQNFSKFISTTKKKDNTSLPCQPYLQNVKLVSYLKTKPGSLPY